MVKRPALRIGVRRTSRRRPSRPPDVTLGELVIEQLQALEDARRDGDLVLPNGDRLRVTNLAKVFWPELKITKGDLIRYYAKVSPYLLPVVDDRPLVMKRFPNGIAGKAFYQQRSREEQPPAGVRIETLPDEHRPDRRAGRAAPHRRLADDAALHDADCGDLAGPVVLAGAVAARRRSGRDRSRSDATARRSPACSTLRAGYATSCTRSASTACQKPRARAACTSTCRCRRERPTNRACCSARSSRRS